MKQSDHLRDAFPDRLPELERNRRADPALEEICADFEQLSADLTLSLEEHGRMSEGLRQDVIASINALKQEIVNRLEAVSGKTK